MILIFQQPDFGTITLLAIILIFMMCVAGSKIIHISILIMAIIPVGIWMLVSHPYRIKRILGFRNPWENCHDAGFQIIQSWLSFGTGGPFGVGLGDGMQKLFYLPEPHTDFIFSVVAEETGFIGVTCVIILFCLFVVKGFLIAFKKNDVFGSLLSFGITILIGTESIINMSVVLGILPTKGLALPFMSYGGSSLIISMISTGIILNISKSLNKIKIGRQNKN